MDLRTLPGRRQFPVAIEVAIPVEPAAEAGFCVGFGEVGKVSLVEPFRQWPAEIGSDEKSLAVLDEQRGGGIGRQASPTEHHAHGGGNVALELGLRHTGRLKIVPVEVGDAALAQRLKRPAAAAQGRRYAQPCDLGEDIRAELAQCQATAAPQSWPTTTACFSPSASTRPTTSPTRSNSV